MDNTVIIIAGGPSLTKADIKRAEGSGYPIMGINNAYLICGKLSYLYACEKKWWNRHYEQVKDLPYRKFILEETLDKVHEPGVEQMKNAGEEGLSKNWPEIYHGKNGGYQAINLAVLLGFKRLILLGYDMQETYGKVHWHGLHEGLNNPSEKQFREWRKYYNRLAPKLKDTGIEVINATRKTALDCFEKVKLKDLLNAGA